MKAILKNLDACEEALLWVGDRTIEEAVNDCTREDWMLWLAYKLDVDLKALILAKGHCANIFRHLMKDERSIKAVDTAIAFGKGEATIEELMDAHAYAYASAVRAAYAPFYVSSYDYVFAAASAHPVSIPDGYHKTYCGVKRENQLLTANICRKYLGQFIIDKCK